MFCPNCHTYMEELGYCKRCGTNLRALMPTTALDIIHMFTTEERLDEEFITVIHAMLEVASSGNASISYLQRALEISYTQATRVANELQRYKIIGPYAGASPRRIFMAEEEAYKAAQYFTVWYEQMKENQLLTEEDFDKLEGLEFEHFCASLLRKNGYDVKVTPGSGDQGIDIIAQKDGIVYGIQCKCYTSDIGNKAVQEAFAGKTYYDCHVGVVLTNRYFTRSAIELSQKNKILLWDRDYLLNLIKNVKQEHQ